MPDPLDADQLAADIVASATIQEIQGEDRRRLTNRTSADTGGAIGLASDICADAAGTRQRSIVLKVKRTVL